MANHNISEEDEALNIVAQVSEPSTNPISPINRPKPTKDLGIRTEPITPPNTSKHEGILRIVNSIPKQRLEQIPELEFDSPLHAFQTTPSQSLKSRPLSVRRRLFTVTEGQHFPKDKYTRIPRHTGTIVENRRTSFDLELAPDNNPVVMSSLRERQEVEFRTAASSDGPLSYVWDSNSPVDIADIIGALHVSAQNTKKGKLQADKAHKNSRRKAVKLSQARDGDGVVESIEETENDEMNSEFEIRSLPAEGARKRKRRTKMVLTSTPSLRKTRGSCENGGRPFSGKGARYSPSILFIDSGSANPYDLADHHRRHLRRPKTSGVLPHTDVAKLQPQPIRLQYERPSRGDHSDTWFTEAFRALYSEAKTFADIYYCMHDLAKESFFQPWLVEHTPEFISYAEQVAEPDPITGWDPLLRDTKERKWLIMGVIMRVIRLKVFDEELFGVNESETELMHSIEKAFVLSEGFHRTSLRANATRACIGDSPVTSNFYAHVATLTAQISLMLQPLTTYLYSLPPPHKRPMPLVTEMYQALHNLVSRSAHLSLTVRLSPTIFHFVDILPGSTYEPDDMYCLEPNSFSVSRECIIGEYNTERATWQVQKEAAKARLQSLLAQGQATYDLECEVQSRVYRHLHLNSEAGLAVARSAAEAEVTELEKCTRFTQGEIDRQETAVNNLIGNHAKKEVLDAARTELKLRIARGPTNYPKTLSLAKQRLAMWNAKIPTTSQSQLEEAAAELQRLTNRKPGATQHQIEEAQREFAHLNKAPPRAPETRYRALTKISVWPVITRYKPGSKADDEKVMKDGPLRQSEKDGIRIMQISKGAVVNYFGRHDDAKPRRVTLRKFVRNKRNELGRRPGSIKKAVFGGFAIAAAAFGVLALVSGGRTVEEVVTKGLEEVVVPFIGNMVTTK